jgi:segregation and condensation protein B
MSLKAKLEAVIYAAEEPVTLVQLALLFTADALEWKAEQEAAAAQAAAAAAEVPAENGGSEMDELAALGVERDAPAESEETVADEPAAEAAPEAESDSEVAQEPEAEAAQEPAVESAEVAEGEDAILDPAADESAEPASDAAAETEEQDTATIEANLKREARQRDKEVRTILRQLLDELIAEYETDSRGVEIREIAGGYRMATKPECHDAVRSFVKSLKPALKLSLPALETLAVVAYKQPVTAPEVNEIRGVDSSGVFGSLLARKLIATAGRKQVIGRPILYKTTKEFLLRFGLKDVTELPSMEEFEKMAAIELDEPEIAAQIEAAPEAKEDAALEREAERLEEAAEAAAESTEEVSATESATGVAES